MTKIRDTTLLGAYIRFTMYEGYDHEVEVIGKVDGMRNHFNTKQYRVCGEWRTMEYASGLSLIKDTND